MRIRLTAPEWLKKIIKKKNDEADAERDGQILDALDKNYLNRVYHDTRPWYERAEDWMPNLRLGNLVSGFVVLMVGFTLIGPISDAMIDAANSSVSQNMTVENGTQPMEDIELPGVFLLMGNKFFLFLMLVVGPFLMWRALGLTRGGLY